jgi:hypothetical protein
VLVNVSTDVGEIIEHVDEEDRCKYLGCVQAR